MDWHGIKARGFRLRSSKDIDDVIAYIVGSH